MSQAKPRGWKAIAGGGLILLGNLMMLYAVTQATRVTLVDLGVGIVIGFAVVLLGFNLRYAKTEVR